MNRLSNLLKDQFFYSSAVASTMLCNILISIVGTRLLTINEYGLLALVKPSIIILSSFFGLGIFQSFLHWRWKKGINKNKLIQTTLGGVKAESFAGDLWETKRTDPSIGADHLPEDISVCIILLWISIPLEGKGISATNEQFCIPLRRCDHLTAYSASFRRRGCAKAQ